MARGKGLEVYRGWGRPLADLDAATLATLTAELPVPEFDAAIKTRRSPRRRYRRGKG